MPPGKDSSSLTPSSILAKFARGLAFWLVEHALAEGWVASGDTVEDCFAGIAGGALPCLLKGVNWLGCELEPRFVELGQQNLAYWHQRCDILRWLEAQRLPGSGFPVLADLV